MTVTLATADNAAPPQHDKAQDGLQHVLCCSSSLLPGVAPKNDPGVACYFSKTGEISTARSLQSAEMLSTTATERGHMNT